MKRLCLYQRSGCHLCEEMAQQLEELSSEADFGCELIDVDADEALRARYHERIPVLEDAEGRVLCEVFLDPASLLNYLRDA